MFSRKGRFLLFFADFHGYNNERTEVCNTVFLSIYSSKDVHLMVCEIKSQRKSMSEHVIWLVSTLGF